MEQLADCVRINARFRRAVNLERDSGRQDLLAGYVVTPGVQRALARVLGPLQSVGHDKAWTLTGPYGSGKSAFSVFLTDLVRPGNDSVRREAQRLLRGAGLSGGVPDLQPVVLTGERAPVDLLLLRALRKSLSSLSHGRRKAESPVLSRVSRAIVATERQSARCLTTEVVECFEAAALLFREKRNAGLLLVIDEAGKILEFAAQQPDRGDIFLFQALAEAAARSDEAQLGFVAVLHQGFEQVFEQVGLHSTQ